MNKEIALGIDVGGSHISCMAYNIKTKELLEDTLSESDIDNHAPAAEIIEAWGKVIQKTIDKVGLEHIDGMGFAMPGPFEYGKGISRLSGKNGKYEQTYGLNVPEAIRSYLGLPDDFKVRFINDATAFAIGEDQVGKASEFSHSLSVTLGTGFGSAFIRDGQPVVKGNMVPENGCLWHLPFEDGIADDYFSTRGLIKRYQEKTGEQVSGVKDIADRALDGDEAAMIVFNDFGEKMGVFLKPWIIAFDMEVLVMGGNISRAFPLFKDSLYRFLEDNGIKLEVKISELKETASFIGSATLIDDNFYQAVLPAIKEM